MSITDLPTKRTQALSQSQTFLGVLPTRWRQTSTGIDMEQLLRHYHPMLSRCAAVTAARARIAAATSE